MNVKQFRVVIPDVAGTIVDDDGKPTGKKISAFILLLTRVLDSVNLKSRRDMTVMRSIEEMIVPFTGPDPEVPKELIFDQYQLNLVKDTIDKMFDAGVRGRGWHVLIEPIDAASVVSSKGK